MLNANTWARNRSGEGGAVTRFHQQPVDAIIDQLGNARDARGYDRKPRRHGFDQDIGNAVAVVVRQHHRGQHKELGARERSPDLRRLARAVKPHQAPEAAGGRPCLEVGPQPAASIHVTGEINPFQLEQVEGFDQVGEAFLLNQPPHR